MEKQVWGVHPDGNIGWFVGYIEKKKNIYFFATKIRTIDNNMSQNEFLTLRKTLTLSAFRALKVIE